MLTKKGKIYKHFEFKIQKSQGQVALIVILVSALAMTLGISLSRTTLVETSLQTDEELLNQAFNAAESGVDYYFSTNNEEYSGENEMSQFRAEITTENIGENSVLDYDEFTLSGSPVSYWLVNHLENGDVGSTYYSGSRVDVCVSSDFLGSLKIDYFYRSGGLVELRHFGHNYGSGDDAVSGLSNTLPEISCSQGKKGVRLAIGGGTEPLLAVVTPLFAGTKISLEGDGNFPIQGVEITSTGYASGLGDSDTGVRRVVKVQNRYKVPAFMLEGVSAGGNITSQ